MPPVTANSTYTFEITSSEELARHPKSGLNTVVVSGFCTDPDGKRLAFVATNNLDMRYPERFKVNWNGSKPRLPKQVGHGLEDERKAVAHKPARGLYMTRGARIAIALRCKQLWPRNRQLAAVAAA
jgi:hypothetical protein